MKDTAKVKSKLHPAGMDPAIIPNLVSLDVTCRCLEGSSYRCSTFSHPGYSYARFFRDTQWIDHRQCSKGSLKYSVRYALEGSGGFKPAKSRDLDSPAMDSHNISAAKDICCMMAGAFILYNLV